MHPRDKKKKRVCDQNYYRRNTRKIRKMALRYYWSNRSRVLKRASKYRSENLAEIKRRNREYYRNNRRKIVYLRRRMNVAHLAVRRAIRSGRLVRPKTCSSCRHSGVIEGHHYRGYARRNLLDVVWLCRPCHRKAHLQLRRSPS